MGARTIGKHNTLHRDILKTVQRFQRTTGVDKVVLGHPKNCRHRFTPGCVKFNRLIPNGIELKAYDGNGLRPVYLYTKQPDEVLRQLRLGS